MLLEYRAVEPRVRTPQPPLLLLLHGIGADENDLLPLAQFLDPRFLILAVRAPHEAAAMGYGWYEIDWTVTPARADPAEMVASRNLLARFVEEAIATYGTDRARTYLLGFSQGAIMSIALLLARPDLVRGVVAHSGRLARLAGQLDPATEAFSRAEVLVLHGAQDEVVPVADGRKVAAVLGKLLGPRLTYQEYVSLGHGISDESLADAARWLTARLDRP